MKNKKPKFKRTDAVKYSKLGVRRKKKQVYRKAKGRDNKIRLNMKGHVRNVKVGFKKSEKIRGLINEKKPVLVHNIKEIEKIGNDEIGILAKIGSKKKKEISEYCKQHNVKLKNLDSEKFIRKLKSRLEKAKEEKDRKQKEKIIKEKEIQKKESQKKESIEDKVDEKKQETKEKTDKKDERKNDNNSNKEEEK
jgi:ribosomal protein L32E